MSARAPLLSAACQEARDPTIEGAALERAQLHRLRCEACQRWHGSLETLVSASTVDDQLGELSRARIQSKLALSLDGLASEVARPKRRPWRSALAGVAAAAAVLLAFWAWPAAALRSLEVPSQGRVSLRVGAAFVSVLGPGSAAVPPAEPEPHELYLNRGRMLIEVEHRPEQGFVVHTPRAEVRVVGTLFAVSVHNDGRTSVDVRRGVVEVDSGGDRVRLEAGQGWDEGQGRRPIDRSLDEALRLHGQPEPAAEPEPEPAAEPAAEPVPAEPEATATGGTEAPEAPSRSRSPASRRAPAPAETPEPAPSADQRYAEAEQALGAGDLEAAARILAELVRQHPTDPLADAALFELAQLAHRADRPEVARGHLEELLSRQSDLGLAESALHLLCRLHLEADADADAYECLVRFRRRFPGSTRDAEVLAAIAGLAEKRGGCQEAQPWLEEYQQLYPSGKLAPTLAERRRACGL